MNPTYEDRAREFIDSIVGNLEATSEAALNDIQDLSTLFNQYKSTTKDYVEAKRKYIEYVQKYQCNDTELPSIASMPGLVGYLPRYTNEEMVTDSQDMIDLGNLVRELRSQIELIEASLEKILGGLVDNVHESSSLAGEASAYLDQLLQHYGDSPYDISQLSVVG